MKFGNSLSDLCLLNDQRQMSSRGQTGDIAKSQNSMSSTVKMPSGSQTRYTLRHQQPKNTVIDDYEPQNRKRKKVGDRSNSLDRMNFQKAQQRFQQQQLPSATIKLNNKYAALDVEMNEEDQQESNSQFRPNLQSHQTSKAGIKVKPIILWNTTHEITKRLISGLNLKCCQQKLRSPNAFQVFPESKEDKLKIIEELKKDSSRQYHTYTENADRQLMFVLKGFERMELENVLQLLKNENVPASKVTFIKDDKDFPIYKVSFDKGSTNVNKLNSEHRYVDSLKIIWEKLKMSTRHPTQCKRCQAWGHSAINCGRPYRCMKCKETHGPNECKRAKDDKTPPYCVNCQQEGHLSSSWECDNFKRYDKKIQARKRIQPREFTSTQAPWAQRHPSGHQDPSDLFGPSGSSHFPPLKPVNLNLNNTVHEPNQSRPVYAQNYQSRQNVTSLEDSRNEFNAIPGIQEAMNILSDFYANLRNCQDSLSQAQMIFKFLQPLNANRTCP